MPDPHRSESLSPPGAVTRAGIYARVTWTLVSYVVVQSLVLGVAAIPGAWAIHAVHPLLPKATWLRVVVYAVGLVPTFIVFAVALMACTAGATKVFGWRPRAGQEMAVREFGWPVLSWARCGMLTHVVRVLAGEVLRGSPLWTLFLRLNGARMGRRVWINSTDIVDHNLLEFGDDVVVGSGVHLSGHTVERGVVKTGRVRVGRNVTIGVGSVVSVGVEIGDDAHVGALSFIPKWTQLEGHTTWVGAPVHRLEKPDVQSR
jgi:acetyltransferase-like isoleucine patch superfamily enzyme